MGRSRSHRSSGSGGQAVTEVALVMPIFILVMFSLLELGRAVYFTQILDSAARDGARYAIVHGFEVGGCPSGPMPINGSNPNPCDPQGNNVIKTVKARAVGVADGPGFVVHVKWCDKTAMSAGTSQCGQSLAC